MNEQLSMQGRIAAFEKAHGGRENSVFFNAMIYYRDGAVRDGSMPEGILYDPPVDDYARLINVVYFYKGRLAQAVRQFDNLKAQLTLSSSREPEALDELKKLQRIVSQCKRDCQEAEAAFMETPQAQRREAARQFAAEEQARAQAWQDQLREIRV